MNESWGSSNPLNRQLIRQFIIENIKTAYNSISHSQDIGIIAAADKNIGVDVEQISRVKEAVIARMSTEIEVKAAPDFACLWAAKEASFKALMNFKQPMIMAGLQIGEWQPMDSRIETFKLMNNSEFVAPVGQGVVIKGNSHVVSIFVFPA